MIQYLSIALFVALYAVLLHNDMHMFQLNSYRASRFLRWLKGEGRSLVLYRSCVVVIGFGLFIGAVWVKVLFGLLLIVCGLVSSKFFKKQKTPLVYTPRVKRLFVCNTLVVAALLLAARVVSVNPLVLGCVAVALLLLSPLVLLISNIVISPVEKMITAWFINDAKRILASHKDLIVIGVTGSYGKTSTKNYLNRVLSERYNVLVTPGNFNTLLGVVRTVREYLRPQHQVFIVEMGAKQQGDIKEICDLVHPSIAILTAVGEAHLETFKSVENIQKTKFELIDSLPSNGLAVLNFDSEKLREYSSIPSHCTVKSYGVECAEAEWRATNVDYNTSGVSFDLMIDGESVNLKSPLLGGGNILNIVASIVVAQHLGVPTTLIQRATQQLQSVEHRLSMRRAGGLTILDDAYNSNPAGAAMALAVLRDFERGAEAKRVVITPGFVEMGSRQEAANHQLGRTMASCCDYAVVVNRVNREAINSGLLDEGFSSDKIYLADSLDDARAHLSSRLKVGDIVLYENDLPDTFK